MLLAELNIRLIHQLAALSIFQLTSIFGKRGILLHRQSLGIDESPVRPPMSKPFVLGETTLDEDTNDDGVLLGVLYGMIEGACTEMRKKQVLPRTIWLHLRYTDGMDVTRCLRLHMPTTIDFLLFPKLESLFLRANVRRQRVRYLSLTFTGLISHPAQLGLFDGASHCPKEEALVSALDTIRTRYGETAVRWGKEMNGTRIERMRQMKTDCKVVKHVA